MTRHHYHEEALKEALLQVTRDLELGSAAGTVTHVSPIEAEAILDIIESQAKLLSGMMDHYGFRAVTVKPLPTKGDDHER